MRRQRLTLLPLLALLLIGFIFPAGSVAAQEEPDWHPFYYDLTEDDYGIEFGTYVCSGAPTGQWISGEGVKPTFSACQGNIWAIQMHWTMAELIPNPTRSFALHGAIDGGFAAFTLDGSAGGTHIEHTFDLAGSFRRWDPERDYSDFWWTNTSAGINIIGVGGEYYGLECDIEPGGCDPGPGGLTFPLKSDDLHEEWDTYDDYGVNAEDEEWPLDETSRNPVYSYSNKLGAPVHAVQGGTVTAVDYDITTDCETLREATASLPFVPLGMPESCYVVVPPTIRGEPGPQLFTVNMVRTARIIIRTGEDDEIIYNYFVSNPSVAVGDVLEAGCIIGEVMELYNPPIDLSSIDLGGQIGTDGIGGEVEVNSVFGSIQTGVGVTVVRRSIIPDIEDPEEPEPTPRLLPELGQEPDENACGGLTSGCLNDNSALVSLNDWTTTDSVDLIAGGGVVLPGGNGGSQIYQDGLVLDDATNYTLTVSARSTTIGDGFTVVNRIRLFVGTEIYETGITNSFNTFSMEFVGEQLAPDQVFGVVNRNPLGTDLEVRYICISEEGTPLLTHACYFKNHHFDDGPIDWTFTPGVTFSNGQAFTYHESIVEQYAALNPLDEAEPADYRLTIGGRLLATSAYTGQSGKYVALYYKYPIGGSFTLIDEIDAALVASEGLNTFSGGVNIEHLYEVSATIEVAEDSGSLLSVQTIVEDEDNYLRGFRIDYICLQSLSTDDGGFPGQDDPGGFIPPFYENCEVISTPEDNNVSSWTYYHWQNLRRFFDCTLMVRLNKMAEAMDSMFKTGKHFMRWIVAASQSGGRWLSTQLMPWLGGHFRNMAIGQVTTVYESGGGTCSDLFCVLEALISGILGPVQSIVDALLSILTGAAGVLFDVVSSLLTIIVALIQQLLGFLQLGQQLLGTLITAYNGAEPATIPGIPQCSLDPRSSAFCMGIWILDNTIFSGTGAAIIPILVGILSIHLLIWVVGEFKRTAMSVGGVA